MDDEKPEELLEKFGKFKMGKACIYVNKIEDIDTDVLEKLLKYCSSCKRKIRCFLNIFISIAGQGRCVG